MDGFDEELPQIREAFKCVYGHDQVDITVIVVAKRHHTRFFGTAAKDSQSKTTTGLLIDSVVTNPEPYNFFLQSHVAVQGTARPAHYHVLRDEMDLGSNIPELTLALCTIFGRATKVVSYAVPAYVADRLCGRGRVYPRPWTQNEIKLPDFTHNQTKNKEGNPLSKEEFKEWKKKEALQLARTPNIWGKSRDSSQVSGDKMRSNPWQEDFDQVMF